MDTNIIFQVPVTVYQLALYADGHQANNMQLWQKLNRFSSFSKNIRHSCHQIITNVAHE